MLTKVKRAASLEAAETNAPVSARLLPPAQPKTMIDRARLLAQLQDVQRVPLALLQAPPGYGKTVLLSQLVDVLAGEGMAVSWMSLKASHRDLFTFYTAFAAAIAACGMPLSTPQMTSVMTKTLNAEGMAAHLEGSLAAATHDIFVFLDDAQVLHGSESLALIALLLDRAPSKLHLVLATRCKLQLPAARLRQRDLLVELEPEQLAFTLEETKALFAQNSAATPGDSTLMAVHERCDGWPGGLALAHKLWRARPDDVSALTGFSGERRQVSEFFEDELSPLMSASKDLADFLVATSILGRMCPALCDAVTGRGDGRAMLDQCEAMGLFVIRLDEERNWYRYHHLFADYLRRRLKDGHAMDRLALHRKACEWLFSANHFVEAFDHAVAAGETMRAAEILDFWCDHEFGTSASVEILTLAANLPEEVKARFPRIMLIEAWRRDVFWQLEGSRELVDMSRERLQQMESDPATPPDEVKAIRGLLVHGEMMIACCSDDMVRTEELSHILIRDYERANLHVRGSFYTSLLYSQREQYKLGDIDRLSRLARSHYHRPGKGLTSVFHEAVVGPSHFMAGRSEVAIHFLSDALDTAIRITEKGSPVGALVALPLSEICYERNELPRARELLQDYLQHMTVHGFIDQMIAAWLTHAKLLRLDGQVSKAYSVLDDAITFAREHAFERLRLFAVAVYIKFLLGDGRVDEALRFGRMHGLQLPAKSVLPGAGVTTRDEARALSWVRLAVAENRIAEAMTVAKQWHSFVDGAGAQRSMIRWDILLAHCLMLSGERRAAQRALRRGVGTAASGRFMRSFLDEGPWLEALLREQTGGAILADQPTDAFAAELLAAFGEKNDRLPIRVEIPEEAGSGGMYGALSTREMDILRLMGTGMLNREIGEKLGMTEGSVKWYVQQIYDKIGVRRRAQVVERAYQLGLISK